MTESKHKKIIVETREEKNKLVEIINDFEVVYFYGDVETGKTFIQRKFDMIYPNVITIMYRNYVYCYSDDHYHDDTNSCNCDECSSDDGYEERSYVNHIKDNIINRQEISYQIYARRFGLSYDEIKKNYPVIVFIITNNYHQNIVDTYPDCLLIQFKNSEESN
jgi:hypothetical protein